MPPGGVHTIKPLEIWFADEARVGQKNKITRRWAKRAPRPSAPKDQRTASAYIFGAICPAHGKGWPGAAALRDRGDDVAPEGDRAGGCPRRACPCLGGPGGLASVEETCGPRQHHACTAPGQGAGVEPGRERLAVHARELD